MQMSNCQLSVPLIVMDGAAIYDANENQYLAAETIAPAESAWLQSWFRAQGLSYFTYTIRRNRTCIFHEGEMNEQEQQVYKRLKRSPYRSYLDGGDFQPEEIVFFKLIAEDLRLSEIEMQLRPLLSGHALRAVVRAQASAPGISALYLYSDKATLAQAEQRLMALLQRDDPSLRPVEVFAKHGYRTEHDAMVLLHRLTDAYEPVKWIGKKKP